MQQIKPIVHDAETRAIMATGRRAVLRLPGRGLVLYGEGENPLGSWVSCRADNDDLGIALTKLVMKIKLKFP